MVGNLKYNNSIYLVSLILILSCERLSQTKEYKQIDSNSELDLKVNYVRSENGLILNDEYYCGGVYFLIENKLPKWIYDKQKMRTLPSTDDYGELYMGIWDIMPPYQLIKKKNSNIMLIIKENDTLKTIIP